MSVVESGYSATSKQRCRYSAILVIVGKPPVLNELDRLDELFCHLTGHFHLSLFTDHTFWSLLSREACEVPT